VSYCPRFATGTSQITICPYIDTLSEQGLSWDVALSCPEEQTGNSKECLHQSLVMNECAFNVWHFTVGAANENVCSHNQQRRVHGGDFADARTRCSAVGSAAEPVRPLPSNIHLRGTWSAKGVFTTEVTDEARHRRQSWPCRKRADCRPSRRHWSAHRHRRGKDRLFVASTSTPAAQVLHRPACPCPRRRRFCTITR
jgi:hypothetical protein